MPRHERVERCRLHCGQALVQTVPGRVSVAKAAGLLAEHQGWTLPPVAGARDGGQNLPTPVTSSR
jgi:hypothetical protein